MNRISKMVNRTILRWLTWRHFRALPELRDLDRAEREARARHERTAHISRAKRALVHQRLKLEIRR